MKVRGLRGAHTYEGIDLIKIISAIAVMCIHCTSYQYGVYRGYFVDGFFYAAVIFFFITSGFFLEGILASKDRSVFFNYEKKLVYTYLFWSAVGLPSMLYNLQMTFPNDYKSWCLRLVRSFVLTGSTGIYWFLLSMIFASLIMYFLVVHDQEKVMYTLAICGFLLGVVWEYKGKINPLFAVLDVLFGNSRNFIMQGLPYMCVGYALAKKKRSTDWRIASLALACSVLVCVFESQTVPGVGIMPVVVSVCMFELGRELDIPQIRKHSLVLRELSSSIYYLHFLFILVFDFYLERPWYVDYSLTLVFCILIYVLVKTVNIPFLNLVFNIKSSKRIAVRKGAQL